MKNKTKNLQNYFILIFNVKFVVVSHLNEKSS